MLSLGNLAELYGTEDIDDQLFLSRIPLEILQKSIESQFQDPLEDGKIDYVQSFLNKYQFSVDNMYEEDQVELDELHDQFIEFMMRMFYEYLSISIPDMENYSEDEQHRYIHYIYNFFITNIKKNFINLILHKIYHDKEDISSILVKKKDVIYLNFKSEISDEYEVSVLSNLSDVIQYILSEEYTIDEFFDCCISEKQEAVIENEFVRSRFDNFSITGNFVPYYIGKVTGSFYLTEFESKVMNKILKKYPKRKSELSSMYGELKKKES